MLLSHNNTSIVNQW